MGRGLRRQPQAAYLRTPNLINLSDSIRHELTCLRRKVRVSACAAHHLAPTWTHRKSPRCHAARPEPPHCITPFPFLSSPPRPSSPPWTSATPDDPQGTSGQLSGPCQMLVPSDACAGASSLEDQSVSRLPLVVRMRQAERLSAAGSDPVHVIACGLPGLLHLLLLFCRCCICCICMRMCCCIMSLAVHLIACTAAAAAAAAREAAGRGCGSAGHAGLGWQR